MSRTIMIEGKERTLSPQKVISGYEKNDDGVPQPVYETVEVNWKYPTIVSKLVDSIVVFGIVGVFISGMYILA